jgi:hypothetical protein
MQLVEEKLELLLLCPLRSAEVHEKRNQVLLSRVHIFCVR